jgi:hypothetical protein
MAKVAVAISITLDRFLFSLNSGFLIAAKIVIENEIKKIMVNINIGVFIFVKLRRAKN